MTLPLILLAIIALLWFGIWLFIRAERQDVEDLPDADVERFQAEVKQKYCRGHQVSDCRAPKEGSK